MLVYGLLLAVTVLIGIPICRLKHGKLIYCILAGLILFAFAALREYVGTDYYNYGTMYLNAMSRTPEQLMNGRVEKGFLMNLKFLSDHFDDWHTLFTMTALFIAAAVSVYTYKNSQKPYLSMFFFLTFGIYFNSLNFMRQLMAACIVLFAMQYIEKKQFIRFTVLVVLASCFHMSALIMLVFFFLLRIKMNVATLGVYTGLTGIFFIVSWDVMEFITEHIYKSYDPDTSYEMTHGLNPVYSIYFGLFFALVFAFRKELVKKDQFNNVLINCMFFSFFFEFIGTRHAILSRFVIYFYMPAVMILLPQVIDVISKKCAAKFKGNKKRITISKTIAVTAVLAVCTGMYVLMYVNDYNGINPYNLVGSERAGG